MLDVPLIIERIKLLCYVVVSLPKKVDYLMESDGGVPYSPKEITFGDVEPL